jgi:hypothetical protein
MDYAAASGGNLEQPPRRLIPGKRLMQMVSNWVSSDVGAYVVGDAEQAKASVVSGLIPCSKPIYIGQTRFQ